MEKNVKQYNYMHVVCGDTVLCAESRFADDNR